MNYNKVFEILRKQGHYFRNRTDFSIEEKSKANYVTTIDKEIEENIKGELAVSFPEVDFVGEEESTNTMSNLFWLLDPIDGTQNFIKAQYPSMISLALVANKEVIFAAIYDPYFDKIYHAYKGKGAFCEDKQIYVSKTPMKRAIIMYGTAPYNRDYSEKTFALARKLFEQGNDIRRSGSACYDLVQVASGKADAYTELLVHSWDFAAGYLLVLEAGGKVSDINGDSLSTIKIGTTSILASNGIIHDELVNITRGTL